MIDYLILLVSLLNADHPCFFSVSFFYNSLVFLAEGSFRLVFYLQKETS